LPHTSVCLPVSLHQLCETYACKLNPTLGGYSDYKRAVVAFEKWEKEARERERRTQMEFWRSRRGHQFERELASLLRTQDYDHVQVTKGSGDRGIDIILRRDGVTTIVQCKQTKQPVGPAAARELYGALKDCGATYGILATVGGVTSGVHDFCQGKPLRVMGLNEILEMQVAANRGARRRLPVGSA
jgi:restriction system protein